MKILRIKQLAFISIFFLIACQEDSLVEKAEPIDEDLTAATELADQYFDQIRGRGETPKFAITVLQYEDGQIYFNTNTDDVSEYQVVTETTVTAIVEPGEFVFWYRGSGLANLEGVDFDADAQSYLNQLPNEHYDLIWVLQVPHDYDPEHKELKYDIVYESQDNEGVVIRLDPKIGVSGGDSDHGSGGDDNGTGEGGTGEE